MNNKEKFDNLIKSVDWDNWQKQTEQCDEQVEYYDLCEILYTKIEEIKGNVALDTEEYDTLLEVQTLLGLLNEKKIKSIL